MLLLQHGEIRPTSIYIAIPTRKKVQENSQKKTGGETMEKLNYAQAEKLFKGNVVFIGSRDVLPVETAKKIFGEEIVEYVLQQCNTPIVLWNCYDIPGKKGFYYLTHDGFLLAVTYSNIELMQAEEHRNREAKDL